MIFRLAEAHETPDILAMHQYAPDQGAWPVLLLMRVVGFHGVIYNATDEEIEDALRIAMDAPADPSQPWRTFRLMRLS